jgi:hypothetical protein
MEQQIAESLAVWFRSTGGDKLRVRSRPPTTLTGTDLKAFSSFDVPKKKVTPQALDKPSTAGGRTKFEVPAGSCTVIPWAG